MNPFSRFLRQWSSDKEFNVFVNYWDDLERIVIRVYRGKMTPDEARPDFTRVWSWLRQHYPRWESSLESDWRRSQTAGEATAIDPFRHILSLERPEDIRGDWHTLQHLPAAREAINRSLRRQFRK